MPPTVDLILSDSGPIAQHLGESFESRPEQVEMARAVAAALESRSRLLVEAGTGVGKSFAYLVPAILRCIAKGEKVVVATATISLQEQLIHKDIPLLMATMEKWAEDRGSGFGDRVSGESPSDSQPNPNPETRNPKPAPPIPLIPILAKGRGNYVSIRRLKLASQRQEALLADPESRHALHVIEDWAYATTDGSLSTLPALDRPDVWDHVRSDSDNCMGRKCPHFKDCFYQSARRELEKANLIICNHALFFSDLALRARGVSGTAGVGGAILPNYDHVILDEAHNIEDAACEHFGLSITQSRVSRLLRTLYTQRRGAAKGYLVERALSIADVEAVDRAIHLVTVAEDASRLFFDSLLDFQRESRKKASAGASGGEPTSRIRQPDIIDNHLTSAMRDLVLRLRALKESVENDADRFELNSYAKRAADIADTAEALVGQTLDGFVYWVEVERDGGTTDSQGWTWGANGRPTRPRVTLSCAPVEVGPILRKLLFDPETQVRDVPIDEGGDPDEAPEIEQPPQAAKSRPKGIILTSATLATRSIRADENREHAETAFSHFMTNLGLPDPPTTRALQLGSPFDYTRQARVIIDLSMPKPTSSPSSARADADSNGRGPSDGYVPALCARILHHLRETDGGAFVLFTSFATLNAAAERLGPDLARLGMPLLVHGRDGSRSNILKKFVESESSVLFGAATFWQGVDVRGRSLRNVIITKLPFEPPDRPVTQARCERIEMLGGNPFMQDSLPRAVIRFKQGFGRLIRSKTDTGRVVVLDPRIKTARYGRLFLQALPEGVGVEELHRVPDGAFE